MVEEDDESTEGLNLVLKASISSYSLPCFIDLRWLLNKEDLWVWLVWLLLPHLREMRLLINRFSRDTPLTACFSHTLCLFLEAKVFFYI